MGSISFKSFREAGILITTEESFSEEGKVMRERFNNRFRGWKVQQGIDCISKETTVEVIKKIGN